MKTLRSPFPSPQTSKFTISFYLMLSCYRKIMTLYFPPPAPPPQSNVIRGTCLKLIPSFPLVPPILLTKKIFFFSFFFSAWAPDEENFFIFFSRTDDVFFILVAFSLLLDWPFQGASLHSTLLRNIISSSFFAVLLLCANTVFFLFIFIFIFPPLFKGGKIKNTPLLNRHSL